LNPENQRSGGVASSASFFIFVLALFHVNGVYKVLKRSVGFGSQDHIGTADE
jgi:hypothetical protein